MDSVQIMRRQMEGPATQIEMEWGAETGASIPRLMSLPGASSAQPPLAPHPPPTHTQDGTDRWNLETVTGGGAMTQSVKDEWVRTVFVIKHLGGHRSDPRSRCSDSRKPDFITSATEAAADAPQAPNICFVSLSQHESTSDKRLSHCAAGALLVEEQ